MSSSTPDQSAISNATFSRFIDGAAKLSATAILVVYVAGFLIVSISHSRYGIVHHDLVRPKILATGIVFLFFVAVGMLLGSITFRVFVYKENEAARQPKHLKYLHVLRHFELLLLAMSMSLSVETLFKIEDWSAHFYWVILAFPVMCGAYVYVRMFHLEKWPRLVATVSALLFVGALATLAKETPEALRLRFLVHRDRNACPHDSP